MLLRGPLAKCFDPDASAGVTTAPDDSGAASIVVEDTSPADDAGSVSDAGPAGGPSGPASPAPEADPFAPVYSALKEHGEGLFDKYADGRSAVEGIKNLARAIGRRDEHAELGRQVASEWDRFKAWREQQEQAVRPQQQPEEPAGLRMPAPLAPDLARYLVRTPEGQTVLAENTPPQAEAKIREWFETKAAFAETLTTNPQALIDHIKQQAVAEARQMFAAEFGQREQLTRSQQVQQRLLGEVSTWAFQAGANGQPLMEVDPNTGQYRPAMTEAGRRYFEAARTLTARGIDPNDPDNLTLIHDIALKLIGGPPQPGQPAPQPNKPAAPLPPGATRSPSRRAAPVQQDGPRGLREILAARGETFADDDEG